MTIRQETRLPFNHYLVALWTSLWTIVPDSLFNNVRVLPGGFQGGLENEKVAAGDEGCTVPTDDWAVSENVWY
jgi:hypothetical protein